MAINPQQMPQMPNPLQSGSPQQMQPQAAPGVMLPNGEMEIEVPMSGMMPEEDAFEPGAHYENIARLLPEELLSSIASDVIDACEADKESRSEWEEVLADGVRSLGLNPNDPNLSASAIEGGCTATHPLLLESAVKFQSKLTAELLPAKGPARVQVIGADPEGEKEKQAIRVQTHLNYQITHEMPEYADETDKMAFHLPLYGSTFKKTYWDQNLLRPVSEFVHIDNFIVAETAKSLEFAERYTHIIEKTSYQIRQDVDNGIFMEPSINFFQTAGEGQTDDEILIAEDEAIGTQASYSIFANKVHTLYEQHVYMALPDEVDFGDFLPYVVTVDYDTGQVLRIQRNWDEQDPNKQMLQWFTHYKYVPGFGFHGLGLIHLLGDMQKTLSTVLRSLVDAGQLANLQGGFKLRGTRLSRETDPFVMGQFKDVDSTIQDISKSIFPLPFKEPSATLFGVLEYLTGASQKFADSTEQVVADSSNYGPVGTTMALLEASVKFFSAIHKRCHRSQMKELKILARLNYQFLDETYPFDVIGGNRNILRQDYDPKIIDVIPASDPNITSQAHRISLAQSKLQAALQDPKGMHDLRAIYVDFYIALGVDDIDKFLPPPPQAQPLDPMSDIMAANSGQPIKAFPGQNHEAHVQFKMAWMQDPTQGGSGMFQNILPIIAANLREHQLMGFQEKLQGAVQATGAATDPQTMEQVTAQAAQQVAEQNRMLAEEEAEGGPAGMLAKAEMMKAQADVMKEVREAEESKMELGIKLLDSLNSVEREKTRADEIDRKFGLDEKRLVADLLKSSAELDTKEALEKAKMAIGQVDMFKQQEHDDKKDKRKHAVDLMKAKSSNKAKSNSNKPKGD